VYHLTLYEESQSLIIETFWEFFQDFPEMLLSSFLSFEVRFPSLFITDSSQIALSY